MPLVSNFDVLPCLTSSFVEKCSDVVVSITFLPLSPSQGQVFSTLGCLVESFKNYKVRIQACSALCSVGAREAYGTEYLSVWRALLHGLDNAQNIVDFQEIRHRDELINQASEHVPSFIFFSSEFLIRFL